MNEMDFYFLDFIWKFIEEINIDLFSQYAVHLKVILQIIEYITLYSPRKFLAISPNLQEKIVKLCEVGINSNEFGLYINSTQAV